MTAPIPADEVARLGALRRYQILDSGTEEGFDRLTRLACALFEVPVALINLVDGARQWVKSRQGLDIEECSRDLAFCAHAILDEKVMEVHDATRDSRFRDNPFVVGEPGIRYYAGAPLITPDGFKLGTLCIIDFQPRSPMDDSRRRCLADLSAMVVDEMELRLGLLRAQKAAREAMEASSAKSAFLAGMSHELRTPLNAILGFAQLMEMTAGSLDDKSRQYVSNILGSGQHLLQIINELLDLSRIESGRVEIALEPVAVSEVVGEIEPLVTTLARHRDITVTRAPGCDSRVVADRLRLKQVLINLASNAIKYNREGGTVGLSCDPPRSGRVRINVTDSGAGIPEDRQAMLFRPYSRLGQDATKVEGTGIGLTLTKRLVEMMGGEIGFVSKPGQGSTFWVDLPVAAKT